MYKCAFGSACYLMENKFYNDILIDQIVVVSGSMTSILSLYTMFYTIVLN